MTLEYYGEIWERAHAEYKKAHGGEHFDGWFAGYRAILEAGADEYEAMVMPSLALSFDAIQSALYYGHFTEEELCDGLIGDQRKGILIGLADDAEYVIHCIALGLTDSDDEDAIRTLAQYVSHFGIMDVYAHCVQFVTVHRPNGPTAYQIYTHEYHIPDYAIPLYVAVDCGARYPVYKSMTDPKNVLTRLTGLTEHETERYERTRTELEAVAGYVNVLSVGRRVARIRYEAHTSHAGDTWPVLTVTISYEIMGGFVTV